MVQDFEAQLEEVKNRIVQNLNPEQIILFGSYAYGTPGADSDVDLLVVMNSSEPPSRRITRVSRLIRPRPFPMDILELHKLCVGVYPRFELIVDLLDKLNPYSVEYRYPGEDVTQHEARDALKLAKKVREFVRGVLGLYDLGTQGKIDWGRDELHDR